jgi:hypothetical protein
MLTKRSFDTRDDLIGALLTSCYIPWYFTGSLCTTFRGTLHCDGGLTNFLPSPSGVDVCVRVCCFPSEKVRFCYKFQPDAALGQLIECSWGLHAALDMPPHDICVP